MRWQILCIGVVLFNQACWVTEDSNPGSGTGNAVSSVYTMDAITEETFFDHPWPSDLRLSDEGKVVFDGYYNPKNLPILDEYVDSMKNVLDGFSPVAAGYLRFSGALDESTLPQTPLDSLQESSSVQLIDIDPNSNEYGQRKRISLYYQQEEGVYWKSNTLAFMPTLGFPLNVKTRYALIVTDSVLDASGGVVNPAFELKQALGLASGEISEEAKNILGSAGDELETIGISKESIVHLAVFTTNDPTEETWTVRNHLMENVEAPAFYDEAWEVKDTTDDYIEYIGKYGPSPNYQIGEMPYAYAGDGGGFELVNGVPTIASYFDLRFSLTVPDATQCPMPENGYPILMYAHGTGGDYRSYVYEDIGENLAKKCVATMGVDQIFHGERDGAPEDGDVTSTELLVFNFQNPASARTVFRQSAMDEVQRARLFSESAAVIPSVISTTGTEIRFDASKMLFWGHSQGASNGALFLAIDPSTRGGVMSGASAIMGITLREKVKPEPSIAGLVDSLLLGLTGDDRDEVNIFHPGISLLQMMVDVEDPIHYAKLLFDNPAEGFAPKSLYMPEGVNPDGSGDSYAPPHGCEVQSIAMGLPLQLPHQHDISELAWGGPEPIEIPADGISGNIADGAASGVLAQWAVPEGEDGHFVVFDVPEASAQATQFLVNLTESEEGLIPAP